MKRIVSRRLFDLMIRDWTQYNEDGQIMVQVFSQDERTIRSTPWANGGEDLEPGDMVIGCDVDIADWPLHLKQAANRRALNGFDPFGPELVLPFPGAGFGKSDRNNEGFWAKVNDRPNGKRIGRRHRVRICEVIGDQIGNDPQTGRVVGTEVVLEETR